MKVEYQIELADITKILIKDFYKAVYQFQYDEFIFILVHYSNKVQGCVSFINYLELFVFHEIA